MLLKLFGNVSLKRFLRCPMRSLVAMELWLVLRYYGKGVMVTKAANSQAWLLRWVFDSRSCYVTLRLLGLPWRYYSSCHDGEVVELVVAIGATRCVCL